MDTVGKKYIVGNVSDDDNDDLRNRQVRCKSSTEVVVAKRAKENGDAEKWRIHPDPPYDPNNPDAIPDKLYFSSYKYDSPQAYLGRNSDIADLQTNITWFVPEPIEGEDEVYFLYLLDYPEKYLTMQDPHGSKEIEFQAKIGDDNMPRQKQKWKFVKADSLQGGNPNA